MKLILVRHGQSTSNAQGIIMNDACGGVHLSPRGLRQAKSAGRHLAKEKFSHIFCSPLNRARETCAEISKYHKTRVSCVEELREISAGKLAGTRRTRYRGEFDKAFSNPNYRIVGGESMNDVAKRLKPFIRRLEKINGNQTALIVAHNALNRVLIASLIGLPLNKCRAIKQKNCAITIMDLATKPPQIYTIDNSIHKIK